MAPAPPPKRRAFAPPPPLPQVPPGTLKLRPGYKAPARSSKAIEFRFRTRLVRATATRADRVHENVLRLDVQPSLVQRLIQAAINCLPAPVQTWLEFESSYPEWSLPTRLVLKKQKPGWEEEFEKEKAAYANLRPLQGVIIPKCFGELAYEGTRALLLSDIGGACLVTPEGALHRVDDMRQMLRQAMHALAEFGVSQSDSKLDNFHVVGDRIMLLDLESMSHGLSKDQLLALIELDIAHLSEYYEETQYALWKEGSITVG